MLSKIHNRKIDFCSFIISAFSDVALFSIAFTYQYYYLSTHDISLVKFSEGERFISWFVFILLILKILITLSFLIPLFKYIFLRKNKKHYGIIKKVRSKSKGLFHFRYEFFITVDFEGKEFESEKIYAYIINDQKLNYGDVSGLWAGKKVCFYFHRFDKESIFIKKIYGK